MKNYQFLKFRKKIQMKMYERILDTYLYYKL